MLTRGSCLVAFAVLVLTTANCNGDPPAVKEAKKLEKASLGNTKPVHRVGDILLTGQPSPNDFEKLADKGFKTVISLRTESELLWDEKQLVEAAGMKFVALPFLDPRDLTDEVFDQSREILQAAGPKQGVCLHCASANRVGAVWLVHRVLDDKVDLDQARKEAAQVGLKNAAYEAKAIDYLKRKSE